MNLPCQTIEDLLPLYHDGVCSQESRQLVEAHLEGCPRCKNMLARLDSSLPLAETCLDDSAPLKKIQRKWMKTVAKAFFKGILITCIICALILGVFLATTQWKCIPVSADLIEVSDVCQLSDGRIAYHLYVKDFTDFHFTKFTTTKDGKEYITPMRSLIEGHRNTAYKCPPNYMLIDVAENNDWQQHHGDGIEITSVYVGPEDNGVLIWEKGMDLPPASQELEDYFNPPMP